MTEWEFVGDAKEWIALALVHNTQLQFSGAKLEQRGSGSNKRRDLTLLDKSGKAVVTGEVKMPYATDGTSPFRSDVVTDARKKAERAGVKYFFTWNVNQCVLWETATAGGGPARPRIRAMARHQRNKGRPAHRFGRRRNSSVARQVSLCA